MTVTPAVKNRCAARLAARKTRRRTRRAQSRDDETHEPRDEAILLRREDVLKRIPGTNVLGRRGIANGCHRNAPSRATGTNVEIETIKAVPFFCSVGLFVFLMFDTYDWICDLVSFDLDEKGRRADRRALTNSIYCEVHSQLHTRSEVR
jgi:hypothetical protein